MNPKTRKKVKCDALLDSGSTVSMMALSLANELGLDLSTSHRTVISGVNGEAPVNDYPIVNPLIVFGGRRVNKTMEFNAMVKTTPITAALFCGKLDEPDLAIIRKYSRYPNHTGNESTFVPTVLFGIKEYVQLINKKCTVLPSGYVLYKTALGPIVSGGSSLEAAIC